MKFAFCLSSTASHNKISNVPSKYFDQATTLETLYVDDRRLCILAQCFARDLSYNLIATLPLGFMSSHHSMTHL